MKKLLLNTTLCTAIAMGAFSSSHVYADDNQAALEARFLALYAALMAKQSSSVEPFKTDNQNAGKG